MDCLVKTDIIAIIPARSGSKRIPKKNITPFMGKPMIVWTIEAAIKSGCFDRVLVSTDNDEIAAIAVSFGADVPFLRDDHSGDHSPVSLAIIETLNKLKETEGKEYSKVVQLMANCPLRQAEDIVNAVNRFEEHNFSSQVSCFKFGWMNPWWAVQLDEKNKPSPLFPEAYGKRSQDLPDLFCPTGAIWMAETEAFLKAGSFYSGDHTFVPVDWISAMDIDNYDDLEMAELLFAMRKKSK
jgi:CMP-N-acetylneuraminic acid synthetase